MLIDLYFFPTSPVGGDEEGIKYFDLSDVPSEKRYDISITTMIEVLSRRKDQLEGDIVRIKRNTIRAIVKKLTSKTIYLKGNTF